MKLERRSLSRLTVPLKALADRFAFGTLIVVSIFLLVVSKADVRLLEAIDSRVSDLLAPVLEVAVQPIHASRRLARNGPSGPCRRRIRSRKPFSRPSRIEPWPTGVSTIPGALRPICSQIS